jgi:hypothetical protein
VSIVKVWASILTLFAYVSGAAAQTIRYEENGQQRTFQFKNSEVSGAGTKPRQGDLPRGPKNTPRDAPGKISGVPGVLENPATNLPENLAARRNKLSRKRTLPKNAVATEVEQPPRPRPRRPEPAAPSADVRHVDDPKAPPSGPELSQSPTTSALEESEARSRMIEQFRARALMEEQRRLESERSRDRHAQSPRGPATTEIEKQQAQATQIVSAPAGSSIGDDPGARPNQPGWRQSICRMLFFGALPGC